MKFAIIIVLLTYCLAFTNIQAQYKGGSGDGYAMAKLVINAESNHFDLASNILSGNDLLQISNYQLGTNYKIDIINASGKIIYPQVNSKNLVSITKFLPKGLYFIRMTSDEGEQTEKFIKL